LSNPGPNNASWRERLLQHDFRRIGLAYAAGLAAGLTFIVAGLPLPWLLGPLSLAIALAASGKPLAPPSSFVHPMRSFIGVAIGSSFGPDVVAKAGQAAISLTLLVPYTLAITGLGFLFFRRVAGFDRPTSVFSAAPAGLADMVMFAESAGADVRRVALLQAARVVTIVFALPFWMQFVGGLPLGGASPKALHIWQVSAIDAAMICLLAWGGWRIADKLGLTGGSVVGPMLASALAHALGLTAAKVPVEIVVLAQVTIGISIGAQFKGISLREFIGVMSWGLAYAVILLVIAGTCAYGLARMTGLDATSLLLSYAPGGQNEMAIIGLILGVDVALIALHHLLRVVIVVVGAQIVLKRG
jgi:uncharacterized protein